MEHAWKPHSKYPGSSPPPLSPSRAITLGRFLFKHPLPPPPLPRQLSRYPGRQAPGQAAAGGEHDVTAGQSCLPPDQVIGSPPAHGDGVRAQNPRRPPRAAAQQPRSESRRAVRMRCRSLCLSLHAPEIKTRLIPRGLTLSPPMIQPYRTPRLFATRP